DDAGKFDLVEIIPDPDLEPQPLERVRNVLGVISWIGECQGVRVLRIANHQRYAALRDRLRCRQTADGHEQGCQTPSHRILPQFTNQNVEPAKWYHCTRLLTRLNQSMAICR